MRNSYAVFAITLILSAALAHAGVDARYLALGDSVAFGFNPHIPYTKLTVSSGDFVGYPESTANADGLDLTNASCPGETTGSFLDASQPDNGCHTGPKYDRYLKVNYEGAPNQMAFALSYLANHPDTQVITINLGGNDLLLLEQQCKRSKDFAQCEIDQLPGTLANVADHLAAIFGALRASGFNGQIIVLTQYATDYADPLGAGAASQLRDVTANVADSNNFRVDVAPGFEAFESASASTNGDACQAGLLIKLPKGTCDVHPSDAGRDVLANTVLSVLK